MSEQVSVKKRGRPKGSKNKQLEQLIPPITSSSVELNESQLLIQLLVTQNKQMQEMMNRTIQLAEGNQQMMRDWFSLFKPPSSPNTATTLEERERAEQEGWEPVNAQTVDEIMRMFTQEDRDYRERLINE